MARTKTQIKDQAEQVAQHILDRFQNEIVRDWHRDADTVTQLRQTTDLEIETMKALKKLVTENIKVETERKKAHAKKMQKLVAASRIDQDEWRRNSHGLTF